MASTIPSLCREGQHTRVDPFPVEAIHEGFRSGSRPGGGWFRAVHRPSLRHIAAPSSIRGSARSWKAGCRLSQTLPPDEYGPCAGREYPKCPRPAGGLRSSALLPGRSGALHKARRVALPRQALVKEASATPRELHLPSHVMLRLVGRCIADAHRAVTVEASPSSRGPRSSMVWSGTMA